MKRELSVNQVLIRLLLLTAQLTFSTILQVMTGHLNGVVAKIKKQLDKPYILGVHCSAHRLELAYKDVVSKVPLYKKVDLLMINLYLFYRNSSLNRSNLIVSFNAVGKPALMPTRIGGTRWLAHTVRAARNIVDGYDAIVAHLQQVGLCIYMMFGIFYGNVI